MQVLSEELMKNTFNFFFKFIQLTLQYNVRIQIQKNLKIIRWKIFSQILDLPFIQLKI